MVKFLAAPLRRQWGSELKKSKWKNTNSGPKPLQDHRISVKILGCVLKATADAVTKGRVAQYALLWTNFSIIRMHNFKNISDLKGTQYRKYYFA